MVKSCTECAGHPCQAESMARTPPLCTSLATTCADPGPAMTALLGYPAPLPAMPW
jgi:hypothetical protein